MFRQWNNWQGCCQYRNRCGCGGGWQQNQCGGWHHNQCGGWNSRCGCGGGSQPWFYGGNFGGRPCYGRDFENRFDNF